MGYSRHAGPEAEWIERVQRGDRDAFRPLVEHYQRRVFSLVSHLVRRRDEVEDIAQEIFIKCFRAIRSYNFESSFGAWLTRVAVNHCYDYLRHERTSRVTYYWQMTEERRRALESGAERPEWDGPSIERQTALRDLVDKLLARAPAEDRIVLVLKELEDRSLEEIADILNLKLNTIKVRLHRARKRMLEDLKRWRQGR